jgi:predicted transcriptional regulator of viral defense system
MWLRNYPITTGQTMQEVIQQARKTFRARGGVLRTTEALAAGIHPRTLYAMRDSGELDLLAHGLFRLGSLPPMTNPDLATVAMRVPRGVVCLTSALAFHQLTTQIPHEVHLAISRSARPPRLKFPPLRVYRFSMAAFNAGIEIHTIDRVHIRIYSPEKTLADSFKYRNKIGMDVFLEALRTFRRRRRPQFQKVLECAKVCRVERLIRPYLEALA